MRVEGLEQFLRDLNLAPTQLKQADRLFRTLAAQKVRDMARRNADAEGSVAAKASTDVRVSGLGRVTLSGNPYDMGAEFGSYQYHQFQRWRGSGDDAGYFFWPAIREYRDKSMSEDWIKNAWKALDLL